MDHGIGTPGYQINGEIVPIEYHITTSRSRYHGDSTPWLFGTCFGVNCRHVLLASSPHYTHLPLHSHPSYIYYYSMHQSDQCRIQNLAREVARGEKFVWSRPLWVQNNSSCVSRPDHGYYRLTYTLVYNIHVQTLPRHPRAPRLQWDGSGYARLRSTRTSN